MEALGFALAFAIGVALGLMGSGGAILSIPVLIYVMKIEPVSAAAYSLFIVGSASLIGVYGRLKSGLVHIRTGLLFAVPSLFTVYIMRFYLMPRVPEKIIFYGFALEKNAATLWLLAGVMIAAALYMIRSARATGRESAEAAPEAGNTTHLFMALQGIAVGGIAGAVGAGGGFLIVPALVVWGRLPIKRATGTSLFIIAINSLVGFTGDLKAGPPIAWSMLLPFSAAVGLGTWAGGKITNRISAQKLKGIFGWFMLTVGTYIGIHEFFVILAID